MATTRGENRFAMSGLGHSTTQTAERATAGSSWPAGGHVAVARLDNLGDVLLSGPAVRAVAERADRVTYIAGPAGVAAARLLPGVDWVVELAAPWVPYRPGPFEIGPLASFVEEVGADRPDRALILTSDHQSSLPTALLLRMARVAELAATSADHPGSLLDVRLRSVCGHEVERNLAVAGAAGYRLADGDDGRLRIRWPLPMEPAITSPYVVVHDGASVPARALPPQLVNDVVRWALGTGIRIVITGAALAHRPLPDEAAGSGLVIDLRSDTSLGELAGVLERAEAVVVGNTGPAHLAAAVGTPVVSVHAPVVPAEQWTPWMVPTVILGDQRISCRGCRARTCPIAGQPCVGQVTAAQVATALDHLVGLGGLAIHDPIRGR